jgi:ABC-type antimicrobial peptide transport system permease subunit
MKTKASNGTSGEFFLSTDKSVCATSVRVFMGQTHGFFEKAVANVTQTLLSVLRVLSAYICVICG